MGPLIAAPRAFAPSAAPSRYERQWDAFSRAWDRSDLAARGVFLGDEWGPESYVDAAVAAFVNPHLPATAHALELGPGGGRYTRRLLARAARVTAVDCSSEMLRRCARRFEGDPKLALVKNDGRLLASTNDATVDYACAFNVFVQLEVEDAFGYLEEFARVLTPDGVAVIHYADFSGPEGWEYFRRNRPCWAADPLERGRFRMLTLETMSMLVRRAGLTVERNQNFGRDAVMVARRAGPRTEAAARLAEGSPDLRRIEQHLTALRADVHDEAPTAHHAAAAREAIDTLLSGVAYDSVLELGCGAGPSLDRFAELGKRTLGVTLGGEPSRHRVLRADMHATGLPDCSFDLVVARHVLEHSPMPLVLLLEMARLTRGHALVVVPCDDLQWIEWPNHYAVLSRPMWLRLFRRAGFEVARASEGPLEPNSREWRFLLRRM